MTTILQLAPPSPDLLQQFADLAERLDYPAPLFSRSRECIFIVTPSNPDAVASAPALVAGVTVHRTDGPYIYFEDFLIHPDFPLTVRSEAAYMLGDEIRRLCAAVGLLPVCPVTVKGAVRILEKLGFEGQQVMLMTRNLIPVPLGPVGGDQPAAAEVSAPPETSKEKEADGEGEDDHPEPDPLVSGQGRPAQGSRAGRRVSARRA